MKFFGWQGGFEYTRTPRLQLFFACDSVCLGLPYDMLYHAPIQLMYRDDGQVLGLQADQAGRLVFPERMSWLRPRSYS